MTCSPPPPPHSAGCARRRVVDRYQRAREAHAAKPTDNHSVWNAIMTDSMFRIPAVRTAEAQGRHTPEGVWSYRFDYPSPAHEGRLGSCHSLDIPFIWGTYEAENMKRFCGEASPELAALSETMMQTYLRVRENRQSQQRTSPRLADVQPQLIRAVMTLNHDCEIVNAPGDEERDFLGLASAKGVVQSRRLGS